MVGKLFGRGLKPKLILILQEQLGENRVVLRLLKQLRIYLPALLELELQQDLEQDN